MIEYKKPNVRLLHATPLVVGEIAGRHCYNSFKLSEHQCVRDYSGNIECDIESSELLDKLSWVHFHESVLEHINLSYEFDTVSREVIIELNRHRILSQSQKSTRYTIDGLVDAFVDCINDAGLNSVFCKTVSNNIVDLNPHMVQTTIWYIYHKLLGYHEAEPLQKGLTGSRKKAQNDRVKRCLPETWLTTGVITINLRSLKNFLKLRSSGSAYYGIQELAEAIKQVTPSKYLDLVCKENK